MSYNSPMYGYAVTDTLTSTTSPVTDHEVDTSKTIANISYDDIRALYEQYQRSEVAHVADHLERVMDNPKYTMSNWEVARLQNVFEKFQAKYTSPLAKALK